MRKQKLKNWEGGGGSVTSLQDLHSIKKKFTSTLLKEKQEKTFLAITSCLSKFENHYFLIRNFIIRLKNTIFLRK